MDQTFAQGLRALRINKRVTQSDLARRSGVSRRAIAYWEAGTVLPRIPELQAALAALAAAPEESAALLALLDTPRALRIVEQAQAAAFAGGLAGTGDLLRAMRLRAGMTQAELAARLRVNRQTVLQWEAMQRLPSLEDAQWISLALNAYPEEKEALFTGHLPLADGKREWTLDDCEAQAALLHRAANVNDFPLMDLYSLTLKRQLRLQTAHPEKALNLLGSVELYRAYWLHLQNRESEGQAALNAAMACMREQKKPEFYWTGVLNLAASRITARMGHVRGGLVVYKQWAAYLPETEYRLWPLCDAAWHMAAGGDSAAAQALLADAERLVSAQTRDQDAAEKHLSINRALIAMRTRLSAPALQGLLEDNKANPTRIWLHIEWITALWKQGETQEAAQAFAALNQQYPEAVSLPYYPRCAALFF